MVAGGKDGLISSPPATHSYANPSQPQAVEAALTTLATSGRMWLASSASALPDLFSSRTSPAIYPSGSMKSARSWTAWATGLRREYSRRLRSERPTDANDCSHWPTASSGKNTESGALVNSDGTPWDGVSKPHSATTGKPVQNALADTAARMWPTAVAHDNQKSVEAHMAMKARMPGGPRNTITSLNVASKEFATRWPTATATDAAFEGSPRNGIKGNHNLSLPNAADRWLTPCANEDAAGRPGANMQQQLKQQSEVWAHAWSTPSAHDGRRPGSDAGSTQGRNLKREAAALGLQAPTATGAESPNDSGPRRLNPLFVTWLMGLPLGWTSFEPLEMGSFRRWLLEHSPRSQQNS